MQNINDYLSLLLAQQKIEILELALELKIFKLIEENINTIFIISSKININEHKTKILLDSAYEAREVNANASSDISIAADIYSLGQIICEMLRGKLLFSNQKDRMLVAKHNKNWHITLCEECNLPNVAANHLKSILSNDPSSRPTVDELIEYIKTWMEEPN